MHSALHRAHKLRGMTCGEPSTHRRPIRLAGADRLRRSFCQLLHLRPARAGGRCGMVGADGLTIQRRRSSSPRPAAASLPARCGCRSPISTPIRHAVDSRRPPLPTADASPSADWGSRMSTNIESLPLLQASIGVGSDEDLVIALGLYLSDGVTALSLAGISFTAAVTSLLTATTIATLSTAGGQIVVFGRVFRTF